MLLTKATYLTKELKATIFRLIKLIFEIEN